MFTSSISLELTGLRIRLACGPSYGNTFVSLLDTMVRFMNSLNNSIAFWTPMHPVRLDCEKAEYDPIPVFMRLADRATQRPK